MIIAVDFDGTIVTHEYPRIGRPAPGAIEAIKLFQSLGARIILLTMRHGTYLENAVNYCKQQGIEFWSVNSNPEQDGWTKSPKVYAHLYIDDAAFGCPLFFDQDSNRNCVDWSKVVPHVERMITWPSTGG